MCQIISFVTYGSNTQTENYLREQKELIKFSLMKKGGESFSFFAVNEYDPENYILIYCDDIKHYDLKYEEFCKQVAAASNTVSQSDSGINSIPWAFVFFSRQAPEMELENNDTKAAPYMVDDKLVWMHGTIANVPQIEKIINKQIKVDSEALAYASLLADKCNMKIEGVYFGLVFDLKMFKKRMSEDEIHIIPTNVNEFFELIYNGIGLWLYRDVENDWVDTWYTTDSSIDNDTTSHLEKIGECELFIPDYQQHKKTKDIIYVSYSGGMDITLSVYAFLKDSIGKVYGNLSCDHLITHTNKEVKLIYFDYGARARKQEIRALDKFYEFLKKEFPQIKFTVEIYDVREIFNQLSNFSKYESKLMKEDSHGEKAETESNLAYVPYRNTEFGLILGAMIDRDLETDKTFIPYVLFGLNLTELGIYVDNTEIWLESMVRIIEYGGKSYKKVNGLAPFINVTKTNMIAFMIKKYGYAKTKELLDIAFSCYYPDENGEPCGKCGSCILREKAIERALKRLKKETLEKG